MTDNLHPPIISRYGGGVMFNLELSQVQISLLAVAAIWSIIWKGIALWKSGRNNQLVWFIILLIVNTLGILEIIYLVAFQKDQNPKK